VLTCSAICGGNVGGGNIGRDNVWIEKISGILFEFALLSGNWYDSNVKYWQSHELAAMRCVKFSEW